MERSAGPAQERLKPGPAASPSRREAAASPLVDHSPRGAEMRSMGAMLQNGPAAVAQRRELQGMFGQAAAVNAPQVSQLAGVFQLVKPGDAGAAAALTNGTVDKLPLATGERHGGAHGGRELKQQLIAAGEDAAKVNALTFMEYDVNAKIDGQKRDAERLVTSSDGRYWYTGSHYAVGSFEQVK